MEHFLWKTNLKEIVEINERRFKLSCFGTTYVNVSSYF